MKTSSSSNNPLESAETSRAIDDSLKSALHLSLGTFSNECLQNLRDNTGRLIRGVYQDEKGGCIFNLLSRPLEFRIDSKDALSMWFTGDPGPELREVSPLYLASREVIHAWDGGVLQVEHIVEAVDRLLAGEPAPDVPAPVRRPLPLESLIPTTTALPIFAEIFENPGMFGDKEEAESGTTETMELPF